MTVLPPAAGPIRTSRGSNRLASVATMTIFRVPERMIASGSRRKGMVVGADAVEFFLDPGRRRLRCFFHRAVRPAASPSVRLPASRPHPNRPAPPTGGTRRTARYPRPATAGTGAIPPRGPPPPPAPPWPPTVPTRPGACVPHRRCIPLPLWRTEVGLLAEGNTGRLVHGPRSLQGGAFVKSKNRARPRPPPLETARKAGYTRFPGA